MGVVDFEEVGRTQNLLGRFPQDLIIQPARHGRHRKRNNNRGTKEEEEAIMKKTEEEKKAQPLEKDDKKKAAQKEEKKVQQKEKDDKKKLAQKEKEEEKKTTKMKQEEEKKTKQTRRAEQNKGAEQQKEKTENVSSKMAQINAKLSNFFKIQKGKGFFWATADVYRDKPVEYMIFSMRDFVFYAMFMLLAGLIAFGDLDYHHNYYGSVVSAVLTNSKFMTYRNKTKTFWEIHKIPEIWSYIDTVLLKVIHNAYYETYEEFQGFKVLTESILVGSPRIRQKRVKNGTCRTSAIFQDLYKSCYDYYHDDIEDKADFGKGQNLTTTAWKYSGPAEDELSFASPLSTYGLGGFVMNFTSDTNLTLQWLQELEANQWIQLGARAVLIEFALYSPNANLFCTVKLLFEILPSGGVEGDTEIITSRLWHESYWDWFIFGCKLIFALYAIYFTVEEVTQVVILKESYFANWWNILDIVVIMTSWTVVITGFSHYKNVEALNKKIHNVFNPEYSSFDKVAQSLALYKLVTAFLIFMVWLKLFKFATLSKTTSFFLSTFSTATQQIATFTLAMTGAVSGFAILGCILLDEVLQFRSFTDSFFTLFGLSVGGLYFFESNKNAFNTEAKFFLVCYIILVLVIFFSAYIAIIVNGFQKAVFELEDDRTRVYFGDVCHILCYKIFHFWQPKDVTADVLYKTEAKKMARRNFEELLEILRRRGCRGMELALLLKKHNLRPGTIISFEAMCDLYNDFLARCQLAVEVEGHIDIMDKLEKINNTVDFLDMTLGDVWIKMDTLANRITIRKGEEDESKQKKKKRLR